MWNVDLALAHRLAEEAAGISLSLFRRDLRQWSKPDGSLATNADIAVERTLRKRLRLARPDDAVLGEEEGQTGAGPRRWIVDAIDGTIDFAAGRPEWGTLIALEFDGRVVLGICDQPANRRRYWAVRGGGAFCADAASTQPRALKVSGRGDLASARSYVPPAEWQPDDRARRGAEALSAATTPSSLVDHPALQLAAGGYEIVVFYLAGPWDLAAPSIIVEEAGGRFTDLDGRRDLFGGTAVFSNGRLHDEALRLVSTALPGVSRI
jgi:histidinol-phosphatase